MAGPHGLGLCGGVGGFHADDGQPRVVAIAGQFR